MLTCATQQKLTEAAPVCNLILPIPDTDFRDYLDEVDELSRFAPKILEEIEKDMEAPRHEWKPNNMGNYLRFVQNTSLHYWNKPKMNGEIK
jgi:hypothetical protein